MQDLGINFPVIYIIVLIMHMWIGINFGYWLYLIVNHKKYRIRIDCSQSTISYVPEKRRFFFFWEKLFPERDFSDYEAAKSFILGIKEQKKKKIQKVEYL